MMIPYDFDGPREVNEGPAYALFHTAGQFAAGYAARVDFSGLDEAAGLSALAEYFAFAFNFYRDRGMAKTLPDWREAFTPSVLPLN
jgi:hypothetical protein